MATQKQPDNGTTIVTDPVPDAVLHPDMFGDAENDAMLGLDTSSAEGVTELNKEQKEAKEKADAAAAGQPDKDEEKILSDIVAGVVQEGEIPRKEEEQTDEAKKKASEDFAKLSDAKKVETLQSQLVTKDTEYNTKISELTAKVAEKDKLLQNLESTRLALEEAQKEPLVFARKYFPQLAEKLDPQQYIIAALKKEFGDNFTYDANEAFTEGTTSYKIRLREAEIRDNLTREQAKAEAELTASRLQREARFNEGKKKVMARYKLTDAGFAELQKWANETVITPEHWALLKFYDQNLKKAAKAALEASKTRRASVDKPDQGAAGLHAASDDESSSAAYKEMADTFGDL